MEALRTLMTSVVTDWRTSNSWERDTMLNIARRGRSLAFTCCMAVLSTILFYLSFNLLNFYRNMHLPQRNLVYGFSYPYDIQKSPNYEITFFIQLSAGIYSAIINSTVDCFVSILLLHMCAQLINLRMTLNNLVGELANKSISSSRFKEGLSAITIRHQHLIRYEGFFNDHYNAFVSIWIFVSKLFMKYLIINSSIFYFFLSIKRNIWYFTNIFSMNTFSNICFLILKIWIRLMIEKITNWIILFKIVIKLL